MELDLGLPWVAPLVTVVLAITFLAVWRRGRDIPALDVRLEGTSIIEWVHHCVY